MLANLSMLLRLPAAVLFIIAGAAKWWSSDDLLRVLASAGISVWASNGIAWLLPPLEAAIGVGLILDRRVRGRSHALAILLLLIFSGFLLWLQLTGRNSHCGCFGRLGLDPGSAMWSLARNLVLLFLIVASMVLARRSIDADLMERSVA